MGPCTWQAHFLLGHLQDFSMVSLGNPWCHAATLPCPSVPILPADVELENGMFVSLYCNRHQCVGTSPVTWLLLGGRDEGRRNLLHHSLGSYPQPPSVERRWVCLVGLSEVGSLWRGSLVLILHCCRATAGLWAHINPWCLFSLCVKSLSDKILLFNKGQKLISYQHSVSDLLKELWLCREIANNTTEKILIAHKILENWKDTPEVI